MLTLLVSTLAVWLFRGQAAPAAPLSPDVRTAMEEINRSLGVECTHCHVPDQWSDASKPPFGIAKNMIAMVTAVNAQLADLGQVSCWTCHAGQVKPSRLPGARLDEELA